MASNNGSRPTTAARPRTAAPPTAGGHQEQWYEEEDDDDDVGMFSFARPSTADQSQPASPPTPAAFIPQSPYSNGHPYSPNMFNYAPHPAAALNTTVPSDAAYPSVPPTAATPALSAAAAYALSMQTTPPQQSGPRKRISFPAPDSPNYVIGNPYEQRLKEESLRRASSGSSRDKIEAMNASWADQRNVSYAIGTDGQAIMLDELGHPMQVATTREEKMLDEINMGDYVDYQTDGVYEEEEDSPYPEVRASVSNIDDPEMPVLTFRAWLIGLLFCIVISALNAFFNLRYPAPLITPIITQVLSYPVGKLLARLLPITSWPLPRWMRRIGFPEMFSFNPGPFNIKEHAVLVIMANISTSPAFGVNFLLVSDRFYGIDNGAGFDILLVLTTQMIGFGIAGLCRRFLVWPASLMWPQNLVYCTLLNTLHAEADDEEEGISRFRFFLYTIVGAFAWYFLPGFLFVGLSAFSWVCWIAPNNVVVNQLFGVSSGLGMGIFTFDWSQIAYLGSPLAIPWWAEVNIFVGFILAYWLIAPIMYYTNVWYSAYLPISTSSVFDRFGGVYNTSVVVDPVNRVLNITAYEEYSPLYLPITYATVYGLALMLSTSAVVHTVLYYGKGIIRQLKRVKNQEEDVHMKLMKNYPEVPDWWYSIFLVIAFALSIATVAAWETQMPVWALIVALIIGVIYILPGGFVFAMTNTQISINLISELVAGYIMPGRPLANVLFKTFSNQTLTVGLSFVQDLKLGHYMKIPPRATFAVQMIATVITSVVQVGVKRWLVSAVPDLCTPHQSALLICPTAQVVYSSSVVWGLIGPARQFGIGRMYNPILWWLLAGAILPVITWAVSRRFPKLWLKYVNVPVAITGAIYAPPATGINFSSWFLVGFVFQYLMRRRHFRWWSKYNFVLSAGLDSGTVLSGIFIFFTLQLPKAGSLAINWWGNTVYENTLDWQGASYKISPPEGFGPTSW
ncbi:hypothetical protein JCM1841_005552 [Sporobolomyces salmonicolor]